LRNCAISPADRRRQAQLVGNDLAKHYGKRNFYSIDQVKQANQRQKIEIDVACWSHALFNTHADFDHFHTLIGEACDYASMKAEMLRSISIDAVSNANADASWFDWDLSWIEFPDIDLSLFDFIDF
jgi:hypothetical protein